LDRDSAVSPLVIHYTLGMDFHFRLATRLALSTMGLSEAFLDHKNLLHHQALRMGNQVLDLCSKIKVGR
jgi:hypothetical protein